MLIIAIPESSSEDQTTCLLLALFLSVFLLLAPICSPHNVVSLHSKKHPPVSLSLLLLCKLLFYFSLPQQATTSSTIAPLSKHGTSDHQHGRPCLLQLVPCMERGPPTLLGCCQLLQNAPFQCYKKPLKKLQVFGSWEGVYTLVTTISNIRLEIITLFLPKTESNNISN